MAGYLPDGNFGSVEREYHHTDLTFFDSADSKKRNPVLVVENKFGSIATAEQLNKYASKFSPDEKKRTENKPDCRFLLISPNRLDCTTAQNARWDFLTYSEFGRELEKHVDREASASSATITPLDNMLLRAAAAYMIRAEQLSTEISESVTDDTTIGDLSPAGDSYANVKLRYSVVANRVFSRLKETLTPDDFNAIKCSFDSGSTKPLVNLEIEHSTVAAKTLKFTIQFQDKTLAVGFGWNEHNEKAGRTQNKQQRGNKWQELNIAGMLSRIIGLSDEYLNKNYQGTGYTGVDYTILTYRIPVREKTVKELIEQICQWTRLALENRQKTSENKQ